MKRSMVKKRSLSLKASLLAMSVLSLMPLAAQADRSSGNAINPNSWVYGPRNDDTSGGRIWNPVKQKMIDGQHVVGRTVQGTFPATTDAFYCSQASQSNADFTWTEMQHSGLTWGDAWRMWAYGSSASCPTRRAIPGTRIAYTDEREIQHALDGGAMVLVVPTVDTVEEAKEVVQWAYYPPFGRRSQGGTQTAQVLGPWLNGANYRQTFNNNLVLIVMIETIEGVKNAAAIAKVPGIHGVFAASGDLGNFSGWAQGDPEYERLITAVHDAAMMAGKRLCGPVAWQNPAAGAVPRPDFTGFQN